MRPCLIELNAFNRGENVDSIRWIAELDDPVGLTEVIFRRAKTGKPERLERAEYSRGVLGTYPDPSIKIAGLAG